MNEKQLFNRLFVELGEEHQILKAVEEMTELMIELLSFVDDQKNGSKNKVCDEIADVGIMLDQLKLIFDKESKLIPVIREYKMNRLAVAYIDTESETHRDSERHGNDYSRSVADRDSSKGDQFIWLPVKKESGQ